MIAQYFIVLTLCYGVMMAPQDLSTTRPESEIMASYEFYSQALIWKHAKKGCYYRQATLTTIDNSTAYEYYIEQMNKNNIEKIWLGLSDVQHDGRYLTVTNEPLSDFGKNQWRIGQPDNKNGGQYCVVMTKSGMANVDCKNKYPYICTVLYRTSKNGLNTAL